MSDCKSSWEWNEASTESIRSHLTGCPHSSLEPTGGLAMRLLGFIKLRETSRHSILTSTYNTSGWLMAPLERKACTYQLSDCDKEKLRCFKQVLEVLKTGKRQDAINILSKIFWTNRSKINFLKERSNKEVLTQFELLNFIYTYVEEESLGYREVSLWDSV